MSSKYNISDKKTWGSGGFFGNRELGALLLIISCPLIIFPFWYICTECEGNLSLFINQLSQMGIDKFLHDELFLLPDSKAYLFDHYAWKIFFTYVIFELLLQRFMPGKTFVAHGAITVSGHVPVYKANGVQSYIFSILVILFLRYDYVYLHLIDFDPACVYYNMGKLLSCSNIFALALCTLLTIKGLTYPSTKESGTNGNLIIDFFWGTDLYPNILGWDVKQFTNCRFGMMFWQIGILCYAMAQFDKLNGELSSAMVVSVLLQTIYIAKFFWWETGYFQSMDIQHDRAGYYICWGCMVWLPSVYTMHTLFLVKNPQYLSLATALFYAFAGKFIFPTSSNVT